MESLISGDIVLGSPTDHPEEQAVLETGSRIMAHIDCGTSNLE